MTIYSNTLGLSNVVFNKGLFVGFEEGEVLHIDKIRDFQELVAYCAENIQHWMNNDGPFLFETETHWSEYEDRDNPFFYADYAVPLATQLAYLYTMEASKGRNTVYQNWTKDRDAHNAPTMKLWTTTLYSTSREYDRVSIDRSTGKVTKIKRHQRIPHSIKQAESIVA